MHSSAHKMQTMLRQFQVVLLNRDHGHDHQPSRLGEGDGRRRGEHHRGSPAKEAEAGGFSGYATSTGGASARTVHASQLHGHKHAAPVWLDQSSVACSGSTHVQYVALIYTIGHMFDPSSAQIIL